MQMINKRLNKEELSHKNVKTCHMSVLIGSDTRLSFMDQLWKLQHFSIPWGSTSVWSRSTITSLKERMLCSTLFLLITSFLRKIFQNSSALILLQRWQKKSARIQQRCFKIYSDYKTNMSQEGKHKISISENSTV